MKKQRYNNSKQKTRCIGENMEVTFSFSKAEYARIRRVSDKRKRSIRSMMLKMFYDMDFKQDAKDACLRWLSLMRECVFW